MSDSSWPHGLCTVHGILQARILEWVAIPFSRRFSQPRDWTQVSHIAGRFFTVWARQWGKPCLYYKGEQKWGLGSLSKWWAAGLRFEPRQLCFMLKCEFLACGWKIMTAILRHITDQLPCWCFYLALGFSVPVKLLEPSPLWRQKTTSGTQLISYLPQLST